ncbi:MAG: hypothetical protein KGZ75_04660 [Syntrophomonadaceae bacterium]|jgi:predicted nucleotidyltransferase|nr:hypothetical protein [Syntrophomonadaceae bacterium]
MQTDWDPYIKAWIEKTRGQKEKNTSLAERACQQAKAMARVLGKEFGARKVYLFGSLLYPERFLPGSDIDLAVEGVSPDVFLKAECRMEALTDFPFDLVDLREASPSFAKAIRSEGKVLYAAEQGQ